MVLIHYTARGCEKENEAESLISREILLDGATTSSYAYVVFNRLYTLHREGKFYKVCLNLPARYRAAQGHFPPPGCHSDFQPVELRVSCHFAFYGFRDEEVVNRLLNLRAS